MKAIIDMCGVLEDQDYRANPVAALEKVDGDFELILHPPPPPPSAPAPKIPTRDSVAAAMIAASASQPDAPLPSRIAVVASDAAQRRSVCVTIVSGCSAGGPPVTTVPYASLFDAADDDSPVLVLCTDGRDVPTNLPPCGGNGSPRAYVIVGEVDQAFREGVFAHMHRWCDLVRGALSLRR